MLISNRFMNSLCDRFVARKWVFAIKHQGQALPIVLACVALGALVITPFLTHAGTDLASSQNYAQMLSQATSLEAGVEQAIWGLSYENLASQIPNLGDYTTYSLPNSINTLTPDIIVTNGGDSGPDITTYHVQSATGSKLLMSSINIEGNTSKILSWRYANSSGANQIPIITGISPSHKNVGDSQFILTVNGMGFISNSLINYNGAVRTTTFVSSSLLSIIISASDLATVGIYPVLVDNPAPGGGISNTQDFSVNPPNQQVEFVMVPGTFTGNYCNGTISGNNSSSLNIIYMVGNNGHASTGTINFYVQNGNYSPGVLQTVSIMASSNISDVSKLNITTGGILGNSNFSNFQPQITQTQIVDNIINAGQQESASITISTPSHSKGSYNIIVTFTYN